MNGGIVRPSGGKWQTGNLCNFQTEINMLKVWGFLRTGWLREMIIGYRALHFKVAGLEPPLYNSN